MARSYNNHYTKTANWIVGLAICLDSLVSDEPVILLLRNEGIFCLDSHVDTLSRAKKSPVEVTPS